MLRHLLFIAFFLGMVLGYLMIAVPQNTPYDEAMALVWRGVAIVILCGIGSMYFLFKIMR